MSSMDWEKYVNKAITTFRKQFEKLKPNEQTRIRKSAFDHLPFEPCQIEVLEFGQGKSVVLILVHEKDLPDKMVKIHTNFKNLKESEFFNKTMIVEGKPLTYETYETMVMGGFGGMHILTKTTATFFASLNRSPYDLASSFMVDAKQVLRGEQVDAIKRGTEDLKDGITRIPEENLRNELLGITEKMNAALGEVKRIDEDIGKLRKLVGVSEELQDWRLLVSEVDRLRGEHLSKGEFDKEIDRLDERIDGVNTRIDDLREVRLARARTILEIVLGIMAVTSTMVAALLAAGIIKL